MTSTTANGSTALVKHETQTVAVEPAARGLMRPLARPAEVLEVLEETRRMLADTLTDGVDYGVIPGTDKDKNKAPKKVLMKPGAEKIAFSFGVRPEYEIAQADIDHERVMRFKSQWVEAPDPGKEAKERIKAEGKGRSRKVDGEWQWQVPGDGYEETTGLYRYVIRCKLVRFDGAVIGEGVGSCSSLESKYRSRPHDVENTVLKMAEKRAFVAAVLTSFGLSEAFTQDLDDGDGEKKPPAPPPQKTVAKTPDPLLVAKDLAWKELDRLQVGVGMSEADTMTARKNCVSRINGGDDAPRYPKTLEEWTKVLAHLKTEPDPEIIDAPGVGDEPGSDG